MQLAHKTGARIDVVRLFAVFHDSKRLNEIQDPQHGPRGAEFARQIRGELFQIDDAGFELLYTACSVHTELFNSPEITIGTCLDADRLDLGRVGITPNPKYMSTTYGKELCDPQFMSPRSVLSMCGRYTITQVHFVTGW